jgi:hypothetical protein
MGGYIKEAEADLLCFLASRFLFVRQPPSCYANLSQPASASCLSLSAGGLTINARVKCIKLGKECSFSLQTMSHENRLPEDCNTNPCEHCHMNRR